MYEGRDLTCNSCGSIDTYYQDDRMSLEHIRCTNCKRPLWMPEEKKQVNNMDWKDLEIGDIPGDFFVNERYEIEAQLTHHSETEWSKCTNVPQDRIKYLERIIDGIVKYRYRLKPLKSIRITQDMMDRLEDSYMETLDTEVLGKLTDRKVEIIGDDE